MAGKKILIIDDDMTALDIVDFLFEDKGFEVVRRADGVTALECVDKGGSILFFAVPEPTVKLPVAISDFWRNEITIKTSYGAAPNDLKESLSILERKEVNVKDMITHRLSLEQIAQGFKLMSEAGASLKVIIEPNRKQAQKTMRNT